MIHLNRKPDFWLIPYLKTPLSWDNVVSKRRLYLPKYIRSSLYSGNENGTLKTWYPSIGKSRLQSRVKILRNESSKNSFTQFFYLFLDRCVLFRSSFGRKGRFRPFGPIWFGIILKRSLYGSFGKFEKHNNQRRIRRQTAQNNKWAGFVMQRTHNDQWQ